MLKIAPLASIAPAEIEQLLDDAFGRDRHQRTAYKLRQGVDMIAALSLAAVEDGNLIGTIQCWPVQLTEADGAATALILVGPVAVRPGRQLAGIGRKLMEMALEAADQSDSEPMVLIGDASYYDRFFDFSARHTRNWSVPGPVDRDRLLARLRPGQTVPRHGALGPREAERSDDDRLQTTVRSAD